MSTAYQHRFGVGDVVRVNGGTVQRLVVDIDPYTVVVASGPVEQRMRWQDVVLVRRPASAHG